MSKAEKYLNHLDQIFQVEPSFYPIGERNSAFPRVTAIIYQDVPETGYITGLTYGLSLVDHPEWTLGLRPELMISVESTDLSWALAIGDIASSLRGKCPFCYGDKINLKSQISEDSDMSAFLVFAPSIISKEDALNIDVGEDYKINLAGMYPIYHEEMSVIDDIGLEAFWHHPAFDLFDINRPTITGAQD